LPDGSFAVSVVVALRLWPAYYRATFLGSLSLNARRLPGVSTRVTFRSLIGLARADVPALRRTGTRLVETVTLPLSLQSP
jgi:hypothetical protein